jgi:hypothetical protein
MIEYKNGAFSGSNLFFKGGSFSNANVINGSKYILTGLE